MELRYSVSVRTGSVSGRSVSRSPGVSGVRAEPRSTSAVDSSR